MIKNTTEEKIDFAKFLRQSLQVGVAENDNNTYSFLLGEWQITTDESKIISIEKFNINVNKIYTSVESMKSDTELTEGKLVQTEGYYNKIYGGGAYYDIVSATNLTADSANCIQLNNGLYAKLHAVNNSITVNQFGAYGDGEHDDASAIQLALNSGYSNVCFENEKYIINDFLTINKDNSTLLGNNSKIVMQDGFQFSNSFDWAIFIGGSKEKSAENINIYNLKIETNNIKFYRGNTVQIQVEYMKNLEIDNCEILAPEIEGNKTRPITNIWIKGAANNININNCNIVNLSNSSVGGSVWISDIYDTNINTVKISNNYIEKSSHDETLGVWDGNIKNITIQNNKFNIHEEKLENISDMNFTFGNANGILQNLTFTNNEVDCISQNFLAMINPADGSDSILIEHNNIKWTFSNSEMRYNSVFNNKSNLIIDINDNNITYNTDNENNPGIYEFSGLNENFYNNTITINGKIQCFQSMNNADKMTNNKHDNNHIIVNTDIYWFYSGYYFCNNTVELRGFINEFKTIFRGSFEMKKDVKISNNTINLKDNGYAEGNIKILYCQNHTFNDYNIYLDNNTILSDINKIQYFIFMQGTKDTKQQTIFCNNNSFGNFKKIGFYNTIQHKINIDGKEITSDTIIE